jgi:hypothetical protein
MPEHDVARRNLIALFGRSGRAARAGCQ